MRIPRAGSGLLEPFDPPALTLEAAITRGWRRRDGERLLEPTPRAFLPTYPYPVLWTPPPDLARIRRALATMPYGPIRPPRPVQALDTPRPAD